MTNMINVAQAGQRVEILRPSETIFISEKIGFASREMLGEIKFGVESIRLMNLLRYRMLFGLASLACLLVTGASFFLQIPYEAPLALFFSTLGTFIVFVMKVANAR